VTLWRGSTLHAHKWPAPSIHAPEPGAASSHDQRENLAGNASGRNLWIGQRSTGPHLTLVLLHGTMAAAQEPMPEGMSITGSSSPSTLSRTQALAYAQEIVPLTEGFYPAFFKLAAIQPGERVLDVGCGVGDTTIIAAQRAGESGEVLGIDISPAFIDLARERATQAGSRARFAVMDAHQLDLRSSYWDVVICHLAIAEFADPATALREFVRVLRPVGRVALSTWGEPERSPWLAIPYDAVHAIASDRPPAERALPFRFGRPGVLSKLLAECGFADVTPDRASTSRDYPNADAYWQAIETGLAGTALDPFAGLSAAQRLAAREAAMPALRKWRYLRSEAVHPPVQAFLCAAAKE